MAALFSPICNESQITSNGDPLSGGLIETYVAGTSTPAPTFTDVSGLVAQTNPIILNTLGAPTQPIWLDAAVTYKFIVKSSVGVVQRTINDISGISISAAVQDQWISYTTAAPTFLGATSFSVPGDQTSIFQVGRRTLTTNSGGVVYSSIATSVFAASKTTVTLVNDSGVLDAGLSQVSYGLLSATTPAVPATYAKNSHLLFTGVALVTTAGSAPIYTATIANLEKYPAPFSLVTGMRFRVQFHANGTTGSNTLNINGTGAKNLKQYDPAGAKIPAIVAANMLCDVEYDGVDYVILNALQQERAGEYFWWPLTSTPSHGLLCNGAAVSRTTYSSLFSVLGTAFGVGDGSTTFNLPNVPTGYSLAVSAGLEGTTTIGQGISHNHGAASVASGQQLVGAGGIGVVAFAGTATSVGGSINAAAAMYARLCVRF